MDTVCCTLGTLTGHPVDYIQVPTLSYGCGRHRKDKVLTEHTEPQRRDEELGEESLLLGIVVRSAEPDSPRMPVPSNGEDALGQTQGSLEGLISHQAGESPMVGRRASCDRDPASEFGRKRTDGRICKL